MDRYFLRSRPRDSKLLPGMNAERHFRFVDAKQRIAIANNLKFLFIFSSPCKYDFRLCC